MPDPTILKMTVADALERADDWTSGLTLHPLSDGLRVGILVLATEVRRLKSNQRAMAALRPSVSRMPAPMRSAA